MMAKKYYTESIPDVEKELTTSIANGLTDQEAKNRLAKYGPNALTSKKKREHVYAFYRSIQRFYDHCADRCRNFEWRGRT